MHLFEATLAWVEAGGGPRWRAWAVEIADLFINRMVDTVAGRIFEVFDEQWKPTPDLEGRKLEPGHQFEWAWLMERWSRLSGDARAHDIAIALRASGERGVDPATGLTVDDLLDDFSVYAGSSRLWPQTERVKANLILADGDPADAQVSMAAVRSAARALEAYLDSPRPGLWRDTPSPSDPGAGAPAPASSFYHIIGAIDALITGGVS
jgi:mannose-6-phosphate isomerase